MALERSAVPSRPSGSRFLAVSVFLAGFCTMGAEMAAPRLLAPYFGSTQLVWTTVIGTILSALAAGAVLGGRVADRVSDERAYGFALFLAGVSLAWIPVLARPILDTSIGALERADALYVGGSLVSVALLFALPTFLLGAILPWAIKLSRVAPYGLGRIAGRLSGLGALGSILGTFSSSLLALPLIGTRRTLIVLGGLLVFASVWSLGRRSITLLALAAGAIGGLAWEASGFAKPAPQVLYERESPYGFVQVRRDENGWTQLVIDEGTSQQSLLPAEGMRTGGVWDALSAIPLLVAPDCAGVRVLMLGFGAGTVASQIEERCRAAPGLQIDGVELDPVLLEAGRLYFGLDRLERTRTYVGDGRAVLRKLSGPYDVVLVDAFRGAYIPSHLVTTEFFAECARKLSPRGLMALNVASGVHGGAPLLSAVESTLRTVFPEVVHKEVSARSTLFSSHVFLAGRSGHWLERLREVPSDESLVAASIGEQFPARELVFTDDRAPVELFTDRWIFRSLLHR